MKLNSVIFHTTRLPEVRSFFETTLGFRVGTFVKDGREVPDASETYVNFEFGGMLLCFEFAPGRTDSGTLVFDVADFTGLRARLERDGIKITGGNANFLKIKDPDGRSLIFEPSK